ncbi:MAG: hypothetical protein AAGA32_16155 [Pseudomonadota bacterium]
MTGTFKPTSGLVPPAEEAWAKRVVLDAQERCLRPHGPAPGDVDRQFRMPSGVVSTKGAGAIDLRHALGPTPSSARGRRADCLAALRGRAGPQARGGAADLLDPAWMEEVELNAAEWEDPE